MRGKSVVVTGAASGIGRGIALRFGAEGASVIAADIDLAGAQATAAEIEAAGGRALAHKVDVADGGSVEDLIAAAVGFGGRLDAVIGAAGLWHGGTVLTLGESEWDRVMSVNIKSLYWLARTAHPHLKETAGSIVTIASTAGLRGSRSAGAYNASKSAVVALTKNLALDFGPDGIRVNCICPGLIMTPMGEAVVAYRGGAAAQEALLKAHPLGRLGTPADIAAAAVFLTSPDASWITGTALVVDGGATAGG
jgi:NAD(P)-dependent dehydrogenase (short-subunit alcohol dehydrogenase family)